MSEENRLCLLEMGIAWNWIMSVFLCKFDECLLRVSDRLVNPFDLIAQVEPRGDRNLVIAASARVKLVSGLSDQLYESGFDKTVDVFGRGKFLSLKIAGPSNHLCNRTQTFCY